MTITVFVWEPTSKNVGHASMAIDGGAYISWWPSAEGAKNGNLGKAMIRSNAYASSMEADRKAEDRLPSWASASISCLDEAAIAKWWRLLSGRSGARADEKIPNPVPGGTYDLFHRNCSTVVMEAMKVGGMLRHPEAAAIAYGLHNSTISPLDVRDMASALSGELGFWGMQRIQTFSPRQRDAWTYLRAEF